MDCNPPGSSVNGISQAEILEWVAIFYPSGSSDPGMEPMSLVSPALAEGSLVPAGKLPRWGGNVNSLQYCCQGKSHGQRGLAA